MTTIKKIDFQKCLKADHKFCIYVRGGLGDTIRQYFDEGDGWEWITPLKEKYPKSLIKLVVLSGNPQTAHFYKYHPQIDCILQGPWAHPHIKCQKIKELKGKNWTLIDDPNLIKELKELEPVKQTKLYLDQQDRKAVGKIVNKGKFIVLHPFAGETNRKIMPIREYFPLVDSLADLGYNIVVVGANWVRKDKHAVKEFFPYKHPNLINLIDKVDTRVAAQLVLESNGLISVRSFCFALTKTEKVKSVLLVSDSKDPLKTYLGVNANKANMLSLGWTKQNLEDNIKIVGVNRTNFNKTRNSIISSFKKEII